MRTPRQDRTPTAPIRVLPTPRGAALVLLGLSLVALDVVLSLAELRALAVTLALGLLAALGTILPARARPLDLRAEPSRAMPGGEAAVQILTPPDGRRSRRAARAELLLGEGRAPRPVVLPALGPGEHDAQLLRLPTAHRGVLELGPVRQVREDPLGLWRREDHVGPTVRLSIAPRSVRLPAPAAGELQGWLSPRLIDAVDDQELALAVLHSLALRRIVSGQALRVLLDGRAHPITSLAELQDELARWHPPPAGPRSRAGRGTDPTGPCIVVTGPGAGSRELRSWARLGHPVALVVRCSAGGPTRPWTLDALPVLDLGRLEDLPQALALRGFPRDAPDRRAPALVPPPPRTAA